MSASSILQAYREAAGHGMSATPKPMATTQEGVDPGEREEDEPGLVDPDIEPDVDVAAQEAAETEAEA